MRSVVFSPIYVHPSLCDGAGGGEEQFSKYGMSSLYRAPQYAMKKGKWSLNHYNNLAVFLHFLQALTILVLCFTYLNDKPTDLLFVSNKMELSHTNYALIDVNDPKTCGDVRDYSTVYQTSIVPQNLQNLRVIHDIMPHSIFDYTNKTILKYNIPDYAFNTNYALVAIFALAFVFQGYNGLYMGFDETFPRIIYNIEASISSGLIVIILAMNAGILELYTLVSLFGIMFGANLLNACAESSSWWMSVIMENKGMKYAWMLPQLASWILLFFAFIPILINIEKTRDCSYAIPSYVTIVIFLEFIFFLLYQIMHTFLLAWRSLNAQVNADFWIDFGSITWSIIIKTFLAWTLLIPALNVSSND